MTEPLLLDRFVPTWDHEISVSQVYGYGYGYRDGSRSVPVAGATSARPVWQPVGGRMWSNSSGRPGSSHGLARPGVRTWRVDSRRLSARWTGPGS